MHLFIQRIHKENLLSRVSGRVKFKSCRYSDEQDSRELCPWEWGSHGDDSKVNSTAICVKEAKPGKGEWALVGKAKLVGIKLLSEG